MSTSSTVTFATAQDAVKPSVDGPATVHSQHLATPAPTPSASRRLVRAALALVEQLTAEASRSTLPLADRASALRQADMQLAVAWRAALAWTSEPSANLAEVGRASALIGTTSRRLPLLAASIRLEAGEPTSVEKDDAPPASAGSSTIPCPPPVPYRALVAQARTRASGAERAA